MNVLEEANKLNIVLAIIGSSSLAALIGGLVTYFTEKSKRKEEKNDLLLFLTASLLSLMGQYAIKDKKISFENLKLITNMYERYKTYPSANGYVDAIVNKVKSLSVEDD